MGGGNNGEKSRKQFYSRLTRLIEDNLRLKVQQRELLQVSKEYQGLVGNKEHEVRDKGQFITQAKRELDHRQVRYE